MVSSGLGSRVIPGHITYSASKTHVNFLAQGLNYELKDKGIDVTSYQAGEVATKLLRRRESMFRIIST